MSTPYGKFSGNPKTEWLSNATSPDRDMKLLEDFSYTDPNGRIWPAPMGSVVNGASIPRPLWSLVGSPYTEDYRNASVVHDVACDDPAVDRAEADEMFYYACLAGGCNKGQARALYLGVRVGAHMLRGTKGPRSRRGRGPSMRPAPQTAQEKAFLSEVTRLSKSLHASMPFHKLKLAVDQALDKNDRKASKKRR